MRFARESAVGFSETGHPGVRWAYAALALAAAQRGDVQTAEQALADLDAEPLSPVLRNEADVDRARGWTALARGEWASARHQFRTAAEVARDQGLLLHEMHALVDHIRTGSYDTVADRFFQLAAQIDGPLMEARTLAVRSVLDLDADGLERAADAFEACGALLHAAEASASAARIHQARRDARAAAACANRATALVAACDGASTPALTVGEAKVVLSKREREVADLAAQGMSNKEIAESLFVSPRTIENHLQRTYEKLGIRSRDELADALGRAS
jgi:DNA-binding NarL/FixJ family response regulator